MVRPLALCHITFVFKGVSPSDNGHQQLADVAYGDAAQEILLQRHSSPLSSISLPARTRSRGLSTVTSSPSL